MTADLSKNTLTGKEVKIPQDDVSERAEFTAFLEGISWVIGHLYEAARRVRDDVRNSDGAITQSGNPQFAEHLVELAEVIAQDGFKEAQKRFTKFDPIPAPSKGGKSTGF